MKNSSSWLLNVVKAWEPDPSSRQISELSESKFVKIVKATQVVGY